MIRKALVSIAAFILLIAAGATAQESGTNCGTYMRRIFYSAEKNARFNGSLGDYFNKVLPVRVAPQPVNFFVYTESLYRWVGGGRGTFRTFRF